MRSIDPFEKPGTSVPFKNSDLKQVPSTRGFGSMDSMKDSDPFSDIQPLALPSPFQMTTLGMQGRVLHPRQTRYQRPQGFLASRRNPSTRPERQQEVPRSRQQMVTI